MTTNEKKAVSEKPVKKKQVTTVGAAEDISSYVSNLDKNVYAITGLPEEFIATLFAWVSRSDKSFREHLKKAAVDFQLPKVAADPFAGLNKKAKDFHEKWTVGYGHSCYDGDTDVLTRDGFKNWSEVDYSDEFASVDSVTMEIEYLKPVRLIAEPYIGQMYKVDRNRVDMLVTPNHKIFAWPRHKIKDFETRKYQLIKAADLKDKCYKVKLGGLSWNGDVSDTMFGYPIEPLLKLFGFFIGDGNVDPRMKKSIQFHIKKPRKIKYLYSLCEELGLNISANKNNKYYITSENNDIGIIMSKCYDETHEKIIPQDLLELDSVLLQYLYDGLLNSDGSIGRTGEVYDTSSLKLANQIQHLCVLLGWNTSLSLLHPASDHGRHKDCWRVFINKKLLESMVNKVQYDIFDEWVNYDGMVYCAELPKNHTLIVRRNGRIHVSGNSVAEHAVAHVGIEKVSRLASAELELSNGFLSITEYSQRYQKPKRGDWHNPFKKESSQWQEYEDFMHKSYSAFLRLVESIHMHLLDKEGIKYSTSLDNIQDDVSVIVDEIYDDSDRKRAAELRKLAFEDARYVLPLSMHTQLGMTANGRAWRDALSALGNSSLSESVQLADDIREEITKVLPVLLKYSTPSQYQMNSKARFLSNVQNKVASSQVVQLHPVLSEKDTINQILSLLQQTYMNVPYKASKYHTEYVTQDKKELMIRELLADMQSFDVAPDVFKHIRYDASLLVSEANWHQLLRHNRMTDFTYGDPTAYFGVTVPPRIVEAGLQDIVKGIAEDSETLYNKLLEEGYYTEAQYVVLNAHRRQVYMSFSLWEAYHLINLRTSEEAQWDIRSTFDELFRQLQSVHPLLFSAAKRR